MYALDCIQQLAYLSRYIDLPTFDLRRVEALCIAFRRVTFSVQSATMKFSGVTCLNLKVLMATCALGVRYKYKYVKIYTNTVP